MEQIEIEISGRVQGVYYKSTVAKIATNLNLKGYIEDKEADVVYLVAQGSHDNVEELLRWTQKGSGISKVVGMSFKYSEPTEQFKKFEVREKNGFVKSKLRGVKNLGRRVKRRVVGPQELVSVPKHVAIIPDGNRRWAREKNWHPWVGHLQITKDKNKLMELFKESMRLGIEYVTFWGFSTENWKRDEKEVNVLMNMMRNFYNEFKKQAMDNNIRFRHIGRKDRFPVDIIEKIEDLESSTEDNDGLNIQFALDYGGRDEIVRAFQRMLADEVHNVDEDIVQEYLDTGMGIPDPDLIIRTGGEKRTSGMMIWQAHYAEMYFTNVLFPDFDADYLRMAVLDYSHRTRRFGGDNKKDFKEINLDELHEPEESELANYALA